jgi:hypothetical protein
MTKKLLFSLSVQVNDIDSDIDYHVSPNARSWSADGLDWHEWQYDPTKQLAVDVSMTKTPNTQSHIIISNLSVSGIKIDQFDQTGTYRRYDTNEVVKNVYGYMSWSGTYTFKIRYSPQIHNYVTYLAKLAANQ